MIGNGAPMGALRMETRRNGAFPLCHVPLAAGPERLGTALAKHVFVIRREPTRPTRRFGAVPGNGEVEAL